MEKITIKNVSTAHAIVRRLNIKLTTWQFSEFVIEISKISERAEADYLKKAEAANREKERIGKEVFNEIFGGRK